MASTSGQTDKESFAPGAWHFAALLAGNFMLALGPWLVRLTDTGPVSAGFWRIFLALPLIALLAMRERQKREPPSRRVILLCLVAGAFFGMDIASWHVGIELTRLGNATLFGNSGSIILIAWGLAVLGRAPSGREWLAVAAALGGAAILIGRSLQISAETAIGDLFCLFAGLCYAFYLLPAQRARARIGQWNVLFFAGLAASPVLLGLALLAGESIWPGDWTPVVLLALSSQVIGQGLLVYSLGHFSALIIGLALLTQPAVAAAIGWMVFGEILNPLDFLGMALVGGALVLAKTAEKRPSA